MAGRPHAPTFTRFLEKFAVGADADCWEWNSNKNGIGYGLLWDKERHRKVLAHRYAYEAANSVCLPSGQRIVIQHDCDNPGCVNPNHLTMGTMKTNYDDMTEKGRRRIVVNPDNRPPHVPGELNGNAKLTDELVVKLRGLMDAGRSLHSLSREYEIDRAHLARLRDRRSWKHVA